MRAFAPAIARKKAHRVQIIRKSEIATIERHSKVRSFARSVLSNTLSNTPGRIDLEIIAGSLRTRSRPDHPTAFCRLLVTMPVTPNGTAIVVAYAGSKYARIQSVHQHAENLRSENKTVQGI